MKIKIRDIDIYYEIYGEGRPILMIHGLAPDHRVMKGAFEPVLKDSRYKRIYFDFPGMGKSETNENYYSSEAILKVIIEFRKAIIGDENYLLSGESYGGYLSYGLLVREPEKIDGLFLICPVVKNRRESRILPEFKLVEREASYLESLADDIKKELDSQAVIQTEYTIERLKEEVISGVNLSMNYNFDELEKNRDFSFPVDEFVFEKPTVILTGLYDNVVGYKDQFVMTDQFKDVSYAVISDTGHNMQIENPELFNAFVKSWIKRIERGKVRNTIKR